MSVLRGLSIVATSLFVLACSPSEQPENKVTYQCGALPLTTELNGETLTLRFGAENAQTLDLKATRSASGARYTHLENGAEFWSKGNEAQFSSDAFSLPLCVVEGTLPQQFNARGNEPFWLLAINGEKATLRQPGSEASFAITRADAQQLHPLLIDIRLDNGWQLTLQQQICYDTMSGQSFPYHAELKTDDEILRGCAGDPDSLIAGASWQLMDAPSTLDQPPSLTFHSDQRVSGFAGCNYVNGRYEITGEGLRFAPLAVTKRMCPQPAMAFEDALLRDLQQVTNVKVFSDNTLQLQLTNGEYLQLQQVPLKLW
ncbi:META domain-containing protein [Pseudidiomarina homiensis]|uniref:META domain-containing protein n=1 Tax=Pseudidiomarina homiensis TaxID=364198 RepID=UPI00215A282A|nr:META domain-containing protein [Pseudidiomarina homiensis]